MSLFQQNTTPKPLPPGGPKTNDTFEELRQHPTSEYSASMVYLVAMMATNEVPMKGDQIFHNASESTWTVYRNPPGQRERKIILQAVQVTHGGSIQFRFLDVAAGLGWRSAYLPTGALLKSVKCGMRK